MPKTPRNNRRPLAGYAGHPFYSTARPDAPRDLRERPLTTAELDTDWLANRAHLLADALHRLSEDPGLSMHARSVAASRADVYGRISTLYYDLSLITEAADLKVTASTLIANGAQLAPDDGPLRPATAKAHHRIDDMIARIDRINGARRQRPPASM